MRQRAEFHALTGLRGLAALWVLAYHYIARSTVPDVRDFIPLFQSGYLGVDLFFVLSGFVLAHTYRATASASLSAYGHFLRKRLARIYPAHLVVLLTLGAAVATDLVHYDAWQTTALDFFRSVLLIEAWVPILTYPWNGVTWSISAEMGAYVLFPLLAAFAFDRQSKARRSLWAPSQLSCFWCSLTLDGAGLTSR